MTGSSTRDSGAKLTYDDLVAMPDDGLRRELIDGELYVTPSPGIKHQTIVLNLGSALLRHVRKQGLGRVFVAPLDVLFSQVDVVEPDVLFVSRERERDVLAEKHLVGAPDLVVEVGSPSTRRTDERAKQRLYERFAVAEYWIVDSDLDVIRVFRLVDGGYQRVAELSLESGDMITTPRLPGLELPLAEIFEG
ncbi:MAG TPA: Uma2 family endonuclease [Vicinamibacterales bacterium]|nr:Uma2 family endonuclease [Vicinamibacterales bacterium]